jgi:hypothetical protein
MSGGTGALAAGGTFTGFNLVGDSGCHNLNPLTSQSVVTARPDNTRAWTQIPSVSVTPGASTINGVSEARFTVTLCGAVPTFPATNGDVGAAWYVCFTPANAASTHRACAWTTLAAGAGITFGVASWDAVGGYTNSSTTVTPAAISGATITMYIPYVWSGSQQVIRVGDVTTNWASVGYATPGAAAVADFAPGYEVNNTQFADSQGLGYDLATGYHQDNVSFTF